MAILKDLIVHGPSHFIGKVFINDSHIAKINGSDVPENPKFTDTVSSMSTTGTGNAITGVSVSNGSFTFTKGSTFLTSQNTAALYAGTSAATTNVSATNTNAHLILKDGSTYNRIKIQGTAEIEVTASSNGILSVGVPAQSPNTFYAGPASSGASATPSFRNIGLADLPIDNLRIGYDQIDDPKNLIINCENPVLDPVSARPRIKGDENSYIRFSEGTQSVALHGVKITSTGAVRPFITFGSSVIGEGTLCGLTPGSTYTFSCKLKYKLLSGGDTGTRYLRMYLMTNKADPSKFEYEDYITVQSLSTLLHGVELGSKGVLTFTVPLAATKVYLLIACNQSSPNCYTAGDYIEATEFRLEEGSIATLQGNKSDLKIGGRNYFAICNSVKGYLYADGTIHAEDTYKEYTCDYIPVSKDEVFTLSTKTLSQDDQPYLAYRFFDSEKNPFGPRVAGYVKCISNIEVPDGAAYIRASYRTHNDTAVGKLELGSIPTDWTPAPQDLLNQVSEELSPQIEDASETANLALTEGIEYIVGTQTTATSSWEGKTRDSKTVIGKTIAYKLPVAGSTVGTTTLTLVDKTTGQTRYSGEVKMNNSPVTTHYPVNSVIKLTYDGADWRSDFYNTNTNDSFKRTNTTTVTAFLPILIGNATATTSRNSTGYKDAGRFAYQPSTQTLKVGQVSASKYTGTGVSIGEIPNQPTDDTIPTSLAVQTAIDNIQIGGRNYLRNTKNFLGWLHCGTSLEQEESGDFDIYEGTFYFPSVSSNMEIAARPGQNIEYEHVRNKKITISAEVKSSTTSPLSIIVSPFLTSSLEGDRIKYRNVYLTSTGGGTTAVTQAVSAVDTWQKVYATVDITDSFFSSGTGSLVFNSCFFGARISRVESNHNPYYIRKIKIEIGNKATDWCPAIEDENLNIDENNVRDNLLPSRLYQLTVYNHNGGPSQVVSTYYQKKDAPSQNWGGKYMGMYCPIEGGKTYTISKRDDVDDTNFGIWVHYTAQEPEIGVTTNYIATIKSNQKYFTFIAPEDANYLFLRLSNTANTKQSDFTIKVEQNNYPTRWVHFKGDTLTTPQMYGALADGVNDDTAAIQKALDSANEIFFPPGIYMINYPLIVNSKTHVYGVSDNSMIRAMSTFSLSNFPGNINEVRPHLPHEDPNQIFSPEANPDTLTKKAILKRFITQHSCSGKYMIQVIDGIEASLLGLTKTRQSSFVIENLVLDCLAGTNNNPSTNKVNGILLMCPYDSCILRNVMVRNCRSKGLQVGDQTSLDTLKGKYSYHSTLGVEGVPGPFTDFYNHFNAASYTEASLRRETRSQTLQIDNCMFLQGNNYSPSDASTSYTTTEPLVYIYNSFELNLKDTKIMFASADHKSTPQTCLVLDTTIDAYVRGCSFAHGGRGVRILNDTRYFRLIGNTYENLTNQYVIACEGDMNAGDNKGFVELGFIHEVFYLYNCPPSTGPGSDYPELSAVPNPGQPRIYLKRARNLQVVGCFQRLVTQANTGCTNNGLNTFISYF